MLSEITLKFLAVNYFPENYSLSPFPLKSNRNDDFFRHFVAEFLEQKHWYILCSSNWKIGRFYCRNYFKLCRLVLELRSEKNGEQFQAFPLASKSTGCRDIGERTGGNLAAQLRTKDTSFTLNYQGILTLLFR